MGALRLVAGLALLVCPATLPAQETASPAADRVLRWQPEIAEASARFGIPQAWIVRVMRAESGGNPRAVSLKGAMGCMQIMPATWATLSARYGLGADPFDARKAPGTPLVATLHGESVRHRRAQMPCLEHAVLWK